METQERVNVAAKTYVTRLATFQVLGQVPTSFLTAKTEIHPMSTLDESDEKHDVAKANQRQTPFSRISERKS